jgi:hypothetical protein
MPTKIINPANSFRNRSLPLKITKNIDRAFENYKIRHKNKHGDKLNTRDLDRRFGQDVFVCFD